MCTLEIPCRIILLYAAWQKKAFFAFATQFHGQAAHKMQFRPSRNLGRSSKVGGLSEIASESVMGRTRLPIAFCLDWKIGNRRIGNRGRDRILICITVTSG